MASGLWTESNLSPDSEEKTYWHLLRDFRKEVARGGATTLKTDVAWVGPGYSFQLNGVKTAYDIVTTVRDSSGRTSFLWTAGLALSGSTVSGAATRPEETGNISGSTSRPTSEAPLSGNPNIGSDMDGIFGGKAADCGKRLPVEILYAADAEHGRMGKLHESAVYLSVIRIPESTGCI